MLTYDRDIFFNTVATSFTTITMSIKNGVRLALIFQVHKTLLSMWKERIIFTQKGDLELSIYRRIFYSQGSTAVSEVCQTRDLYIIYPSVSVLTRTDRHGSPNGVCGI